MKKSNKRVPKSHLPKYAPGGSTMYNENGNNLELTGGSQDAISAKRNQGISSGQYAAYGQIAANGLSQMANNSRLTGEERKYADKQSMNSTADSAIGQVPGFGQYYGLMKGASDFGKSQLGKDEYGNYKTGADKAGNEIMTADHSAMINDINNKNYVALGLDSMGIGKFGRMASDLTGQSQKTTGFMGKVNKALGITPDIKPENNAPTYALGGESQQPNAEIESQENVVAPNGGFLQADGPTHQNGGVPVNIPPGSIIFSDRLKAPGTKKTYADLNKINNTIKEDKILESNKYGNMSKRTAELMKFAKNKTSEALFQEQEALKQAKVQAYARRMGVTLPSRDNEQMESQGQSEASEGEYAYGGQYPAMSNPYHKFRGNIPMYPNGGPVDSTQYGNKVNTVPSNFSFEKKVGNKQVYIQPGSIDKAKTYNPDTQGQTDPNQYNEFLKGKLQGGVSPEELVKQGYATPDGIAPLKEHYNPKRVYVEPFNEPTTKAQQAQPYAGTRSGETLLPKQSANQDWNTYSFADLNGQTNKSVQRNFDNTGNEFTFDGSYNKVPTGKNLQYYRDTNVRSDGQGSTMMPASASTIAPVITHGPDKFNANGSSTSGGFAYGGRMLPKFGPGGFSDAPDSGKTDDQVWEESNALMNRKRADGDYGKKYMEPGQKPDWSNIAMIGMNQLAQNAGNIYNLSRFNKPEIEKYERAQAKYLDDSAAIRDANDEARRAEYNVRGASGGNAGTYLSNRVGLNTANIMNKDRIRQQYANANAGIGNQNSQFNSQIAMQEVIANAQNRAAVRNGKATAIGSIGQNIFGGMRDSKLDNMDQNTLDLMMKYYNTPEFQKMMKDNKFKKK